MSVRYTKTLGERICVQIAAGKTTRAVCAESGMPSMATLFRWLSRHEEFQGLYQQAKEVQVEILVDEILEIADDSSNDVKTITRKDGSEAEVIDREAINRSRLRVDARKWLASKLFPKKYGERQQMEVTGANGGPVEGRITVEFVFPEGGGNGA